MCVCSLQEYYAHPTITFHWLLLGLLIIMSCNHVQESLPSSLESLNLSRMGLCACPFCRYLVGRCFTPLRLRIARLVSIIMSHGKAAQCHMCHAFYYISRKSTQTARNVYAHYFAEHTEYASVQRQLVGFIAERSLHRCFNVHHKAKITAVLSTVICSMNYGPDVHIPN